MKKTIILIITILICCNIFSQEAEKVKYTPDYRFKEGLFLNLEAVKANKPIPFQQLQPEITTDDFSGLKKITEQENFTILKENGSIEQINKKLLWGFSWKGILYVRWNEEYNRVPVLGNISHFIANKTTYSNIYPDPTISYGYGGYYNPHTYNYIPIENKEIRQYIIDFESGKIMDYNSRNLEIILARDAEIYNEFVNMRKRKKNKMMFFYLRKYNNKHPLYLNK